MASHPCRPLSAKLWKGGMSSWLDWRLGNDLHFCKVRSVVFHTELADNSTSPSGNWRGNTSADVPDSFLCAVIFSYSPFPGKWITSVATQQAGEEKTSLGEKLFWRTGCFCTPLVFWKSTFVWWKCGKFCLLRSLCLCLCMDYCLPDIGIIFEDYTPNSKSHAYR